MCEVEKMSLALKKKKMASAKPVKVPQSVSETVVAALAIISASASTFQMPSPILDPPRSPAENSFGFPSLLGRCFGKMERPGSWSFTGVLEQEELQLFGGFPRFNRSKPGTALLVCNVDAEAVTAATSTRVFLKDLRG